jgi:hypothetical protein
MFVNLQTVLNENHYTLFFQEARVTNNRSFCVCLWNEKKINLYFIDGQSVFLFFSLEYKWIQNQTDIMLTNWNKFNKPLNQPLDSYLFFILIMKEKI